MIIIRILSLLVLAAIIVNPILFLVGTRIDRGKRNTAANRARSYAIIRVSVAATILSWVLSAALAVSVIVCLQ